MESIKESNNERSGAGEWSASGFWCRQSSVSENVGSSPTARKIRSDTKSEGWCCDHCNVTFRTRALYFEHRRSLPGFKSQSGFKLKKEYICPFCNKKWTTTKDGYSRHLSHFCSKNPNSKKTEKQLNPNISDKTRKIWSEVGKRVCEESHFWEYRSKHPIVYKKSNGEKVRLDSELEHSLVKKLDELKIDWYRPRYTFKWIGNDKSEHKYFPDFYIPQYKCFIECKSEYVERSQNQNGKCDYIKKHYKFIKWIQT